ncbi:MAG: cysteine desulfurase [Blastochloris sp.]|nr:cysteine desulfurase [Blastochloris sp.]
MLDVQSIRRDFPTIQTDSVYLDSAASSLTPFSVLDAMTDYYHHHRTNLHRGMHKLAMETARKFDAAVENIANFIGAKPEELSITTNATHAINQVALSLDFQAGDEIIVSTLEHSSNVFPWLRLAEKEGVILRWWIANEDGLLDIAALEDLLTDKTRLVAVTHVSNVLGSVISVAAIGKICNDRGILYLVDACQSVPHLTLDVRQIGCDFLAFSGHKMCGPTGIGILYLKERHAQRLSPAFIGGGTINTYRSRYNDLESCTLTAHVFSDLPHKWIAGTPPIAETLGLSAAIDYLATIGFDHMVAHDQQLVEHALAGLSNIPYVDIFGPLSAVQRSAIVSFNIGDLSPLRVGRMLTEEFNIGLRAGHNCALNYFHEVQPPGKVMGNVRASFYLYTTIEEIDHFLSAVETIASTQVKSRARSLVSTV